MKIKELQKEIAELLIFIAEYHSNMEQEVDDSNLRFRLYDIIDKSNK